MRPRIGNGEASYFVERLEKDIRILQDRDRVRIRYWRPTVDYYLNQNTDKRVKEIRRLRNSELEWAIIKAAKPELAEAFELILSLCSGNLEYQEISFANYFDYPRWYL